MTTTIDAHIAGILLAYSVLIVGIMSPGPAVIAIIGTAMERGRTQGVYLASGVVCGSAFWGISAALGMAAILTKFATALWVIKIIGGLFLLWLAFKSLRSALYPSTAPDPKRAAKQGTPRRMWMTGFLIHLTNPKAIIAWVATIALGVTETSPLWVSFAIVLGGIVISTIGNLGYALIFSTKPVAAAYLRAKRPIEGLFAAFFGFAGFKLLTSKLSQ